jgi:hypothetical protein
MDCIKYFERQVGNKCAIHAINNCLQYSPPLVGDDSFNRDSPLNIAKFDPSVVEERSRGYSMESVLKILDRLNLDVVHYSSVTELQRVHNDVLMKKKVLLRDTRFIGVLKTNEQFHYVSLVPLRQVSEGSVECRWVILDSLAPAPVLYSDSAVKFYWLLQIRVR